VEPDESTSEVVLNTVGSPTSVNVVTNLKHTRTSMSVASLEHAIRVVPKLETINHFREATGLRKICCVDGVEIVATIETTRRTLDCESAILELIGVCLGGQVPDASRRIYDSSSSDTNRRVDVNTSVKISSQEWDMHVAALHDSSGLCVDLVQVILRRGNVDILNAVITSVNQRLRENLLRTNTIEVAG